jgi:hypothetical protein
LSPLQTKKFRVSWPEATAMPEGLAKPEGLSGRLSTEVFSETER